MSQVQIKIIIVSSQTGIDHGHVLLQIGDILYSYGVDENGRASLAISNNISGTNIEIESRKNQYENLTTYSFMATSSQAQQMHDSITNGAVKWGDNGSFSFYSYSNDSPLNNYSPFTANGITAHNCATAVIFPVADAMPELFPKSDVWDCTGPNSHLLPVRETRGRFGLLQKSIHCPQPIKDQFFANCCLNTTGDNPRRRNCGRSSL